MVDIVINENIMNHLYEYDAIIICTNCYQVMRNGFQYEVSKKYQYVLDSNYNTKYGDISKLGTFIESHKDGMPTFILAFTTFGYNFKGNEEDFFDYDSLGKCLKTINILYSGKHLASIMIGCNQFDGNADKERVLKIINDKVKDFDLTIYDYKQESHGEIRKKEYMKNLKIRYGRNKEKLKHKRDNIKKK